MFTRNKLRNKIFNRSTVQPLIILVYPAYILLVCIKGMYTIVDLTTVWIGLYFWILWSYLSNDIESPYNFFINPKFVFMPVIDFILSLNLFHIVFLKKSELARFSVMQKSKDFLLNFFNYFLLWYLYLLLIHFDIFQLFKLARGIINNELKIYKSHKYQQLSSSWYQYNGV